MSIVYGGTTLQDSSTAFIGDIGLVAGVWKCQDIGSRDHLDVILRSGLYVMSRAAQRLHETRKA